MLVGFADVLAHALMANLILEPIETDPDAMYQASCNNACWSVGEVSMTFPDEFANYAPAFALRLCELMGSGLVV